MSDEEYSSHRLFDPPMAVQRYIFTRNCIQRFSASTAITSVLDLGCHNCSFVKFLKQLPFLSAINCLDVDVFNLQRAEGQAKASPMDLLMERSHELNINLYLGSALEPDIRFKNCAIDAVTAIELVEHLQPEMLPSFVDTVFGYIQPKVAIITTPNYEYNKIIQRTVAEGGDFDETQPSEFRDSDHKFEWTRAEFVSWCKDIISQYGNYTFEIDGVGRLDSDEEKSSGFCTQIAIFNQKHFAAAAAPEANATKVAQVHKLYRNYRFKRNIYPD